MHWLSQDAPKLKVKNKTKCFLISQSHCYLCCFRSLSLKDILVFFCRICIFLLTCRLSRPNEPLLSNAHYIKKPSSGRLKHIGSELYLISITCNCRDLTHVFSVLFIWRANLEKTSGNSCREISVFCTAHERGIVATPYHPISAVLSVKWSLTEDWKPKKIETLSSKSSRLQ